jgi:hypothetical protein
MKHVTAGCMALMVGCGSSPVLPPLAPPPVDVEVRVEQTVVASGEAVVVEVTTWTRDDWTLPPALPGASELDTVARGTDGPAVVGDRVRMVATYELSGADGSHVVVVPAVEAVGPADQTRTIEPPPVFVDIGTSPGALDGLVDPEAIPEASDAFPPWMLAAAGAVAVGLLLLVVALVRRARTQPLPPPLPAEVVARDAWSAARRDELDDHALALALSQIFRGFLQAVTGFPMLTRTTREIVQHLEQEALLNTGLLPRTRRVLDATDRLKFAREGGGQAFFDSLQIDFLAVVDALSSPLPEENSDA